MGCDDSVTEGKAGIFIGRPWCIDSVKDVTSVAPDAVVKAYYQYSSGKWRDDLSGCRAE